jgi:large subunit ribosomal protein L1
MAEKTIVNAVKTALDENHNPKRNFRQSVDLTINLKEVDMNEPSNRIDEEVLLPHGRGEPAKIGVFATGEMALTAKEAADAVFQPDDIEEIASDTKRAKALAEDFDFFTAEAPLMPTIGKTLGRYFGPRGKMPRPLPPTADIDGEVKKLRDTVRVRTRSKTTFHCLVGKEDMDAEALAENVQVLLKRVEEHLERGQMNIKSIFVKTTMGSPVRVA